MTANKVSGGVAHNLPADLRKALLSDSAARAKWEDITPLARNEWICWTISVKKVETRKEHIERVVSELKEGMRRPCCWIGCTHRADKSISRSQKFVLGQRSKKGIHKMKKTATVKILILAGGPSSEYEVSVATAKMVLKNLDRKKYRASLFTLKKNFRIADLLKQIGSSRPHIIFIAMHGPFGEGGSVQAILESLPLAYTGSGVASSAAAMDKVIANALYKAAGLRVPRFVVFDRKSVAKKSFGSTSGITFPVVVKPVKGGSSIGVSVVKAKRDLSAAITLALKEDDKVMFQEYIKGTEITCAVLEGRDGKPFALPPTEIIPQVAAFFDYRAKYEIGGSVEITPARLPAAKIKEVQALALKAHKLLDCRGMSRSDFMLKGSRFYILETNTIPGMTETSLSPQGAKAAGISFPEMLDMVIAAGLRR